MKRENDSCHCRTAELMFRRAKKHEKGTGVFVRTKGCFLAVLVDFAAFAVVRLEDARLGGCSSSSSSILMRSCQHFIAVMDAGNCDLPLCLHAVVR